MDVESGLVVFHGPGPGAVFASRPRHVIMYQGSLYGCLSERERNIERYAWGRAQRQQRCW